MIRIPPMKMTRWIALLALVAVPAFASGPLRINQSDTGFLFSGKADTTAYSFDVPGKSIRTSEGEGRIFATIDGVMVQLLRVPAVAGTESEALEAHRKTEVAYLEQHGAVISPSTICSALAIPHREWRAELKGVSTSTFLTIPIENTILVLVVAFNASSPPGLAEQQMAGICNTLKR